MKSAPRWTSWFWLVPAFVALAVVPYIGNAYLTNFVFVLIIAFIVAQSWDWLGGEMGYVNLGHFCFCGVGAYAFCILVARGYPVHIGFAAAVGVSGAVAALLAFPLFRLRGDYFSFATLTLLPLAQLLAFNLTWLTNGGEGISLPPHYVLEKAYLFALVVAFLALGVTVWLTRARIGYAMRGIRNDEEASEVGGVRIFPVKLFVMSLSASFAGLAGAIQSWQLSFIDPPTVFGIAQALVPIAMALLGGSGLLWGPTVGVLVFGSVQQTLIANLSVLHAAIYGSIILLIGRFMPGGLLRSNLLRAIPWFAPLTREHQDNRQVGHADVKPGSQVTLPLQIVDVKQEKPLLECRNVTKEFRGLVAVNDLTMTIRAGEIVGLVGPNGSGKTTLFNCISKVYPPTRGQILFDGNDITVLRRDEISRLGIGRSFQIPRPFSDMSVRENIAVPLMYRNEAMSPAEALERAEVFARFVELDHCMFKRADSLSVQEKKSLELARALACQPKLLLVDEVASGLTPAEVKRFTRQISELREKYGMTVIWVEHNFPALAECVDRLVVLESGSVIADQPLEDAVKNERVLSTYLGQSPGGAA